MNHRRAGCEQHLWRLAAGARGGASLIPGPPVPGRPTATQAKGNPVAAAPRWYVSLHHLGGVPRPDAWPGGWMWVPVSARGRFRHSAKAPGRRWGTAAHMPGSRSRSSGWRRLPARPAGGGAYAARSVPTRSPGPCTTPVTSRSARRTTSVALSTRCTVRSASTPSGTSSRSGSFLRGRITSVSPAR
jgi:hypothetical protein